MSKNRSAENVDDDEPPLPDLSLWFSASSSRKRASRLVDSALRACIWSASEEMLSVKEVSRAGKGAV